MLPFVRVLIIATEMKQALTSLHSQPTCGTRFKRPLFQCPVVLLMVKSRYPETQGQGDKGAWDASQKAREVAELRVCEAL